MEISLIPTEEFIRVNRLLEITNPVLFERGNIPTFNGLLSTEIFGQSVYDRKTTFAYIDLGGYYFQPQVYKSIIRMNANFTHVINGTKFFIIKNGDLVEDESGDTGLVWLYNNWDKLKFKKNESSIRTERILMLENHSKEELFTKYQIVIPAYYRDLNLQSSASGKISHHEVNDKYAKLIRAASILKVNAGLDIEMTSLRSSIQATMVEIFDLLRARIEKKGGLIKKSLLGKSIDYGSRTVISAPIFDADTPEDMAVNLNRAGIPLGQVCALFTPYIVTWVREFFQREIERLGGSYPVKPKDSDKLVYLKLKSPEVLFNEQVIEKEINRFIGSHGERFKKIQLEVADDMDTGIKSVYMAFAGRYSDPSAPETESPLITRPATWCDILYQAAVDVTKDKHIYGTRYPILDYFGTFPAEISVLTTLKTVPMYIGDKVYPRYPVIDFDMSPERISVNFIDTATLSNTLLMGLGGDLINVVVFPHTPKDVQSNVCERLTSGVGEIAC